MKAGAFTPATPCRCRLKAALLDLVTAPLNEGGGFHPRNPTTAGAAAGSTAEARAASMTTRRAAPRCMHHPNRARAILELSVERSMKAGAFTPATAAIREPGVECPPSTLYRVNEAQGLSPPQPPRPRSRPVPDWIEWKRHQIWIYDMTHFPRAGRVAYAILA